MVVFNLINREEAEEVYRKLRKKGNVLVVVSKERKKKKWGI
jgi:hypothetical protein